MTRSPVPALAPISSRLSGPLLLLLLGAGCIRSSEERIEERHEAAEPAMDQHEAEANAMRDALVGGDLEALRVAAGTLRARLPLGPSLPPIARPVEVRLAASVDRVLAASDLPAAADAVGAMAQACGDCHTTLGLELSPAGAALHDGGDTVLGRMLAHRGAAVEAWQGVVAGDDPRLQAAVVALDASTLAPTGTAADAPVPPDAAALEVRVHDLAGMMARAAPGDRGRYLGEMLGTCAECHRLLDAGPGRARPAADPAAPSPP